MFSRTVWFHDQSFPLNWNNCLTVNSKWIRFFLALWVNCLNNARLRSKRLRMPKESLETFETLKHLKRFVTQLRNSISKWLENVVKVDNETAAHVGTCRKFFTWKCQTAYYCFLLAFALHCTPAIISQSNLLDIEIKSSEFPTRLSSIKTLSTVFLFISFWKRFHQIPGSFLDS